MRNLNSKSVVGILSVAYLAALVVPAIAQGRSSLEKRMHSQFVVGQKHFLGQSSPSGQHTAREPVRHPRSARVTRAERTVQALRVRSAYVPHVRRAAQGQFTHRTYRYQAAYPSVSSATSRASKITYRPYRVASVYPPHTVARQYWAGSYKPAHYSTRRVAMRRHPYCVSVWAPSQSYGYVPVCTSSRTYSVTIPVRMMPPHVYVQHSYSSEEQSPQDAYENCTRTESSSEEVTTTTTSSGYFSY